MNLRFLAFRGGFVRLLTSSRSRLNFGSFASSALTGPRFDPAANHSAAQKEKMKNIFVGNLSYGATEDGVRSMFEQYGAVERVNLVTDRDTGQARGFGFVEMTNGAEADRAIAELNGRELDGRSLNVNEARPKPERGSGRAYGGGGGSRNRW